MDQYTLLKKAMEHLGKQLNVSGSFWQGRMSEDDQDKIYMCTIVNFSMDQKVAPNSSPRMDFKVPFQTHTHTHCARAWPALWTDTKT